MLSVERFLIRGAGELASGVAACLHSVGFPVILLETEQPLAVRRRVSFSEAVYDGSASVEGIVARRIGSPGEIDDVIARGEIPLLVDPQGTAIPRVAPLALIDAIIAKKNLGTHLSMAPIVIGIGPGFVAGQDVHAAIETNRGHDLGRILWQGSPQADTGSPAPVLGRGPERVLRAPAAGIVRWQREIGDIVETGDSLGEVGGQVLSAPFDGIIRGLIRDGLRVETGLKIGDIDPRRDAHSPFTVSDKARAIGGASLQALLILMHRQGYAVTRRDPGSRA